MCCNQVQVLQEDPADHKLALASYLKGLNGLGDAHNSSAAGSDASGVQTLQSAWTNIAVLHEHMDNPTEAVSAYENALSKQEPGRRKTEENQDSDSLLRITDPENRLFWEWKELPVTATINKGSRTVRLSASVGGAVRKGTHVRIGAHLVSIAQGPEKQRTFEIADVGPTEVDGPALEGPLHKKVHKIRVSQENVSMVFNLALLHEKQGHHEAAQELHKAVLAEHPTYVHSEFVYAASMQQ